MGQLGIQHGTGSTDRPFASRVGLSVLTSDVAPGHWSQEVWHVGADASRPSATPPAPRRPPPAPSPLQAPPLEPVQSYRRGQVATGKAVNLTGRRPSRGWFISLS